MKNFNRNDQSFDGYCPTCGQPWQGHINKLWFWLCILMLVAGIVLGSVAGYYATIVMSYRGSF